VSNPDEVYCPGGSLYFNPDEHVTITWTFEGELAYYLSGDVVHLHHITESGELRCLNTSEAEFVDEWLERLEAARDEAAEFTPRGDGQ